MGVKRRWMLLSPAILAAVMLGPPEGAQASITMSPAKSAVTTSLHAATTDLGSSRPCRGDCKRGFRTGYREGYQDCLRDTQRSQTRGFGQWARGYEMGYQRGFYACD